MSQKIKKQIRKSMPVFMIFSLLVSTSVAGLVFNLDFKIIKTINERIALEIGLPEVQADTASTTVTVKNAAPIISGNVAEVPVHASNTPVNVGDQAVWQALANDPESNDYFLLVCETEGATASTSAGSVPSCDGGGTETFCVSGSTVSGAQSTCTDAALEDPTPSAETDVWYAYVCDNHPIESQCSLVNQGSGDSGSPIYINHAPGFTAVITSDDNKDPGGTFTVTASTTDTDSEDQSDEVYLSVCATNSWATSTGCAGATWCTGTSTVDDVSCSFATTTPARDGIYTYYAFVKDWHEMPAVDNSRNTTYTVNNVAPTVSNVAINGGVLISVNMKGDVAYIASSSADLSDDNGCLDITDSTTPATSSIFISSSTIAVGGLNCAADDNNCYQIADTACAYVPLSCSGGSYTTASYVCTTTISHYAIPTDIMAANPFVDENWLAGMTAIDDDGLKGSAVSGGGVELESLEALAVTETEIPYGSIRGGQDSGAVNATTTVINYGNIPMDTIVEGTDMDKSDLTDIIFVTNQEFDLVNFSYVFNGNHTLSSTTPETLDTVTAKPTNTSDVSDQIFWGIGIPGGTTSGDYAGTNTFMATLDASDW